MSMPATNTVDTTTDSNTRTVSPVYPDVDMVAADVCAACPRSIIVDFALSMLEPVLGGHTLNTFKSSDLAVTLNNIPRGSALRVSFRGARSELADSVLVALDAAGFKLIAVAHHDETMVGKPGKEKPMRDGMLAFSAPVTLEDEVAAFGRALVGVLRNPLLS